MSAPEIDLEVRRNIARLKQAYCDYERLSGWIFTASTVAGILAGVGVWFSVDPRDRDQTMFGGVIGLGFAIWFCGIMCIRLFLIRPDARCPRCSYDWGRGSEGELTNNLLIWKYCPGCGLKMTDGA
jgi:hypothetical protein